MNLENPMKVAPMPSKPAVEVQMLQALLQEQRALSNAIQEVFSQEAQSGEERPMRELLEELLLGREADREIMSQLVQQQNQIVQFFDCLGTR